jgi:hypothetical protein
MFGRTLKPAALPRRILAGVIDTLALLALSGGIGTLRLHQLRRRQSVSGAGPREQAREMARAASSPRWRAALVALTFAQGLAHRRHRTPGERLLGLLTVEARTGEPPSAGAVVRRLTYRVARQAGTRAAIRLLRIPGAPARAAMRENLKRASSAGQESLGTAHFEIDFVQVALVPILPIVAHAIERRLKAAGWLPTTITVRATR